MTDDAQQPEPIEELDDAELTEIVGGASGATMQTTPKMGPGLLSP